MDNIVYNPKDSLAEIRRLRYNSVLYRNFNEINGTDSGILYETTKTVDSKGNIVEEPLFIKTWSVGYDGHTYETGLLFTEKNRLQNNELKETRTSTNLIYNYDDKQHVVTISTVESLSIITNKDDGTKTLISDTSRKDKKRFILNNDGNAYLKIR